MARPEQRCSCRTIPTFLIDILLSDLENLGFALQIPMNCVYREKQQHLRSTTTVTQMKFRISYSIFTIIVKEAPNSEYALSKTKSPQEKRNSYFACQCGQNILKSHKSKFLEDFYIRIQLYFSYDFFFVEQA